jgi:YVTN family beta-propeller protein
VTVIDTVKLSVVREIAVGNSPWGVHILD